MFRTLLIVFLISAAKAQIIQTIVGGGPNNTPTNRLGLDQPSGLAVDSSGNVYVSVFNQNQIWKITADGNANRFAGTGSPYSSGDGGSATQAGLSGPSSLAFDRSGNLYVVEVGQVLTNPAGANRVRRISTSGVITTVAGNGNPGYTGDGGPATSATLFSPKWVAVDSAGNLIISTYSAIRLVSPAGIISTVAGSSTGTGSSADGVPATSAAIAPYGLAVDASNAVIFADHGCSCVRRFLPGGTISTVAGNGTNGYAGDGGPAVAAQLENVNSVTVDSSNNLYIVGSSTVRKIAAGQTTITTYSGTGVQDFSGDGASAATAKLWFDSYGAIAFNSTGSNAYLLVYGFNILKISAGIINGFAGNSSTASLVDNQQPTSITLGVPGTVATDTTGNLYFSDSEYYGVRGLSLAAGAFNFSLGTPYAGYQADGMLALSLALSGTPFVRNSAGDFFFVDKIGYSNIRIRRTLNNKIYSLTDTVNPNGFGGDGGPALTASFLNPSALALASNGDLYIADTGNNRVRVINATTGIVTTIAGSGAGGSNGDGGLATNASLISPSALSLDGAGNLFVAEQTGRVRKVVLSTGRISSVVGQDLTSGSFFTPDRISLFADQSSNVFISSRSNAQVTKVDGVTGTVTTVAGSGVHGFSGDGGSPLSAALDPTTITIDRSQNLYIGDASGRIRKTTVAACFFTVSSPVFSVSHTGGTYSVAVTATNSDCPYKVASDSPFVTITSGASGSGNGTVTFNVPTGPTASRTATVNIGGASFAVQQVSQNSPYTVGYFDSSAPQWVIDSNMNFAYDLTDKYFPFAGQPGAVAVTGDWNGDGHTKVGFYINGFWVLDYNGNGIYDGTGPGGDKFCALGGVGYTPVVGDWSGDGKTKIGFYKDGYWALDTNGNCQWDGPGTDSFIALGGVGYLPVVGDWNGNGKAKVGYYYQGKWALDYDGDGAFTAADKYYANFPYAVGDRPVVGDWTGDGKTKIGVFRNGFWVLDTNNNGTYDGVGAGGDKFYGFGGNTGEVPVVADWNGSGTSKIGVFVNGFWVLDYNGNGSWDGLTTDRFVAFGNSAVQPIIGRW